MKRTVIISFIMLLSLNVLSQEPTDAMLFGDIRVAGSNEHIPFASVTLRGTNIGTMADGSGHFKLANLPLGKQIIVAQAIGYKTQAKEVFMEANKATQAFIELEEDALNLEQVVVTATRSRHYIKNVPVRTEVITAKALQNKNAGNLFQALEGTPGIRVENQCQFCNFTMIRMQGLGAEHTQILINGQPIYSGLASVYGLQQLSTIDIDRIEVIKGAGSALYGSGAIAGAINIITKEPALIPLASVDLQFGNHQTNRYGFSSSLKNEKGNIGLLLYAQRISEGAIDQTGEGENLNQVMIKDGISDRVATKLNNMGFSLFVDNVLFDNDRLVLSGKSINETREGGLLTDNYYKNPFTDGTENIITDRYETSLHYSKEVQKNSFINYTLAYIKHNREATNDTYLNDYMDTHNDSLPDLLEMRPNLADENTLSSTISFSSKLKNHNIIAGIQGFYTQLNESGKYVVVDDESPFYGVSYQSEAIKTAREIGIFIQDEWQLGKKWMIVPGIRLDNHYSKEEYSANLTGADMFPASSFDKTVFNPRLAIKFDLSPKISIRLNSGTGFRAPYGFSEDLHLCSGSPRVWKSSDLEAERSFSINASADYYGKNFRLSTNFFRTELRDKIAFTEADHDISNLGYDYQWKNIDDAWVQGIELTLLANPLRHINFGFDLTLNQGEYQNIRDNWEGSEYEEMSKFIPRFPATTINSRIEYNPQNWFFSLSANYQGSMYIDYYNEDIDPEAGDQSRIKKTKGYFLFNAKAAREIGQFRIYAGIDNIFNYLQDEKYLDDAAFMYAPVYGTMFYGGISFKIYQ